MLCNDYRARSEKRSSSAAKQAKEKGIPTLFATGHPYPEAPHVAVGCLMKPYSERQLKAAIEAVDRHLSGDRAKPPRGLELFGDDAAA